MNNYSDYRKSLINRFWEYQRKIHPEWGKYLELSTTPNGRPPVFLKKFAEHNVLIEPNMDTDMRQQLLGIIPIYERHRWFRSMTSSQAIALSIFGNLKVNNRLHFLHGVCDDEGMPLFENASDLNDNFHMEYAVTYLGEPRTTSLDGFISGDHQIAIECKLSEAEVGTCSRPKLNSKCSNYGSDHCDGTYSSQRGRASRCSLTERGILYWRYVPEIFSWKESIDHYPCPLRKNYQLVRNILAACVRANGKIKPDKGRTLLIYDERNPAFWEGGNGYKAFVNTKRALYNPALLRRCSWQKIVDHLRTKNDLTWLTDQISLKYGL